jgi:uncharacterized delta-60 repeat protein
MLGVGTAVLLGVSFIGSARVAKAADGDFDPSFGLTYLQPQPVTTSFGISASESAYGVVTQPDGRVIVAGRGGSPAGFALARYNSDGSLDTTFDVDGRVLTSFVSGYDASAEAVRLQADGKIVVGGYTATSSVNLNFALARYNPDGSLDSSFGSGGKIITSFADASAVAPSLMYDVALAPNGDIVAVGRVFLNSSGYHFAMARYSSNGTLLAGPNALPVTGGWATSVAVQTDGKIVMVGRTDSPSTPTNPHGSRNFVILRCDSNGNIDNTFNGGVMSLTFSNNTTNNYNEGQAVVIQSDGKILAAGHSGVHVSTQRFALARFNTDGTNDISFGTGGRVVTQLTPNSTRDAAHALAVRSDGKIIAAGQCSENGSHNWAIARYLSQWHPGSHIW